MDNDNKINLDDNKLYNTDKTPDSSSDKEGSLHEEVMLFLGDEVNRIHQDATCNNYDIEEEYAKTKKNHSPYNILVLFGAFIVVIATVFFVNKYITHKDQEIKVSLDEFEDLNLNNLLNTVAAAQVNYDDALKSKLIIETEYETKQNDLQSDYENELYVLDSLNLSNRREYNRRKSKITFDYNKNMEALEKEYEGKIILAQKQVDAYKEQLDEFDSVKVASAQEKEKLINSERQLKQIEIDKLKKSYESQIANMELAMKNMRSDNSSEMRNAVHNVATKYQAEIDTLDPKLNDAKAKEIMAALQETADFDISALLAENKIEEESVVSSIEYYQELYNNYKYLDDVVKSIPQKHSIPEYVSAARNLVNNMSQMYLDTSVGYYEDIVTKRGEIESLNKLAEDQQNQITEQQGLIENQEKNIADKQNQIENQKLQLEEQQVHYESVLEEAKNATTSYISVIFKSLHTDGLVLTIDENNIIQVAVSPDVKAYITEAGLPARIKLPIKMEAAQTDNDLYIEGNIVPGENGSYYFELATDAEGNPIPVDLSFIRSGTNVEVVKETIN